MGSLTQSLLTVHSILRRAGIPHALCGGIAANLYREEVRATADVDIAVTIGPARVPQIVAMFEADGWGAEPYWRRGEQLRLSHPDRPRVDCIIATTDFERSAIDRATSARIEGHDVPVLRPEDLIIFKLIAGRARDFEAVAAIINAGGDRLDVEYITGWLEQFEITDAWERALDEARREAE